MEKTDNMVYIDQYRKSVSMAVASLLVNHGVDMIEIACFDVLTEMFQCKIGSASRTFCEHSGRTIPLAADVLLALIDMGLNTDSLTQFALQSNKRFIITPQQCSQQRNLYLLKVGTKKFHPPHIPYYMPSLPDPHTYIRTPTHKQPVTEYEAIREKAAIQKRDVERALTKFLCRTSETNSVFENEDNGYPLISCKSTFPSYMAALNPIDQVFDFEELEYHYQVANRTEDITSKENESGNEDGTEDLKLEKADNSIKTEGDKIYRMNDTETMTSQPNQNIDNPFLKSINLPKKSNKISSK